MRRSVDEPRSMPDRVSDASTRLAELARAQGRGAPALRSQSGSVLEVVDTASAPTLVHSDAGVGAKFENGTLSITDQYGTQQRDLAAREVKADKSTTERIVVNDLANINAIFVNALTCYGALSADNVHANTMDANFGISSGSLTTGNVACRDIHQEGFGLFTAGILNTGLTKSNGFQDTSVSLRAVKRDIRPLGESALQRVRDAAICRFRFKPDAYPGVDPGVEHIGPMVDDLPAHAVADGEHGPAPELGGMLRYAWEAIRELADKVDAQASELAELRARLP